jgi:hypothetical protein
MGFLSITFLYDDCYEVAVAVEGQSAALCPAMPDVPQHRIPRQLVKAIACIDERDAF